MIKAGYLESTLRSVPESLLIDNVVDNSVRNLIKNGLYKDTRKSNNTFEGLTNLHNDLDTLFKIVDAIVETSTPTITIPSGSHQLVGGWYKQNHL